MRYTIDRIVEQYAVLENSETLETAEYPTAQLPKDAKEGDILVLEGTVFRIDKEKTEQQAAQVRSRFEKLIKK